MANATNAAPRVFDADAYAAAVEPPMLKIGGHTYRGRVLSITEWLPFEPRIARLYAGELSAEEFAALTHEYARALFPKGSWPFWLRDPVAQLLLQTPETIIAALTDFFGSQLRAMGLPAARTTKTPGTDSQG